jgi:hypothetical protein
MMIAVHLGFEAVAAAGPGRTVADVVGDGAGEEHRLLPDELELLVKTAVVKLGHVRPAELNL